MTLAGRRVVFVLGSFELGGAERQAILLARELGRRHGADVEVWGFPPVGAAARWCEAQGVRWRELPLRWRGPWWRRLAFLGRFAAAVRRARVDLLVPYTITPNVVCGLTWRWAGARACVWNQRDEGIQREPAALERRAVRATPYFVANSDGGRQFLAQTFGLDPERVEVVPNGVEVGAAPRTDHASGGPGSDSGATAARTDARRRLGIDGGRFVACMAANLHSNKDHATLLDAWRRVVDDLPGLRPLLLLAGRDEDAAAALRERMRRLRLDGDLQFLGPVDDVPALLSAVDLAILSSRSEGLPNAVLESMAAGLPVVGTDIPGIREAVGEEGAALLSPAGDPAALAERIVRLARDPALRERAGSANRRRIALLFDLEKTSDRVAALLAAALAGSSR